MIRWVNFYQPCDTTASAHPWRTTSWTTREDADRFARPGRIACVMVEFNEGAGLSEESRAARCEKALHWISDLNKGTDGVAKEALCINDANALIKAAIAIANEALRS